MVKFWNMFLRHPISAYKVSALEFAERSSFYCFKFAILLAMTDEASKGGYGLSNEHAMQIYSWFVLLCYSLNILGGYLAKKIGEKASVILGGILIAIGHGIFLYHCLLTLYIGLIFIIIGTTALKPNISSLVIKQYKGNENNLQTLLNQILSLLYLIINAGALLGVFFGTLGYRLGNWKIALSSGAFIMIFAQILFMINHRSIKEYDHGIIVQDSDDNNDEEEVYSQLDKDKIQSRRNKAILTIAIIAFFFNLIYEAGNSSMQIIAKDCVDNKIFGMMVPASFWHGCLNPLLILCIGLPVSMLLSGLQTFIILPAGLFISALSVLPIIIGFVLQVDKGILMSPWFYIAQQGLVTFAELLVFAFGLASVGRYAKDDEKAIAASIVFTAIGVSSYISVRLFLLFKAMFGSDILIFYFVGSLAGIVSIILLLLRRRFQKLTCGLQ